MLKLLLPPLIGAVIGYCTNYIAVKMLFRPYRPIRIGKWTLPFTPGVIPKRKPELAHAVGNAVGKSLLGENEMLGMLKSDNMKDTIAGGINCGIQEYMQDKTLGMAAEDFAGEESWAEMKEKAGTYLSEKIAAGIQTVNIQDLIVEQGKAAITQMGGMVAMFVNDSMIAALAQPIARNIEDYIAAEGYDKIKSSVMEELDALENKNLPDLVNEDIQKRISGKVMEIYDEFVEKKGTEIAKGFDVCTVVEEKINAMDVRELESLILSVMKHELGMVVNLGALIGFVLGLLNLLI